MVVKSRIEESLLDAVAAFISWLASIGSCLFPDREQIITLRTDLMAIEWPDDEHIVSERRACTMIGICRMTVRYLSPRPDDGWPRKGMKAPADKRRRFGYRRLHILQPGEGYVVSHKLLLRLYKKLSSAGAVSASRRWGTRTPDTLLPQPNQPCSLDFVSD